MPDDPTPHGGEAMHPPPDRAKIPQPQPEGAQGEGGGEPGSRVNENMPSGTPASQRSDSARDVPPSQDKPRG